MTRKQHPFKEMWIGEVNKRLGYKLLLRITKILYEGSSEYNEKIIIAETKNLGKILLLGEKNNLTLQYSDKYPIYDEMLANIPLNSHPKPEKVLIIGGGDGEVLKNVLRYKEVSKAILVEIDKKVIESSKKYFEHREVFEDPRVEIVIEDGAKFLAETDDKFDVIIGDYTDPYQGTPAATLVSENFYKNARDALKEGGIISVQSGSPIYQKDIVTDIFLKMKRVFGRAKIYTSPSPIYPGGIWSYCIANIGESSFKPLRHIEGTVYYNEDIHEASFVLPNFIKTIVK